MARAAGYAAFGEGTYHRTKEAITKAWRGHPQNIFTLFPGVLVVVERAATVLEPAIVRCCQHQDMKAQVYRADLTHYLKPFSPLEQLAMVVDDE